MTDRLGPLLRRLRARAGLTQEQLAERSGVSVRTIRRLETGGTADHRLGTVNLLADALEVGPEDRRLLADVLGRAGDAPPGESGGPAERRPTPEPAPPADPVPPLPGPRRPAPRRQDALADAADELAREVRRRLRREEEQRRVHDPFPLPVRWRDAPPGLTDHSANIQRLAPGAAADRMDLSGDLRGVVEVYRRISSGRLVVLGRAGSGKSILTIRFALDVLGERAAADPVPVIFSVGSWDPSATALREWLVGRLLRDHPHLARRMPSGTTLAAALVDADLVLPVLDGFDEIAEGLRCEALEALNSTSLPLVLTSRRGEFAEAVGAAHAPLVWAAGIELADLAPDDLADYLPRTARPVGDGGGPPGDGGTAAVWETVLARLRDREDAAGGDLARVLTTPLMVVLARTMYSDAPDRDPLELLDADRFPTAHALEEHLLAGFVPTVYRRRAPGPGGVGPEPAQRWLGHLAHHLVRLDGDQQDLAWWKLPGTLPRSTRATAVFLVSALCVTLANWLVGLVAGLLGTPIGVEELLAEGALMGPVAGLAFGSVYGVTVASGGGVFEPTRVRLRLPRAHRGVGRGPVRTFTSRFGTVLVGGFVMGVGCACALALERTIYLGLPLDDGDVLVGTAVNMLAFGLIFGSAVGLVFGIVAVLEAPLDVASAATPVSLLATNRIAAGWKIAVLVPLLTVTIALDGWLVVGVLRGFLGPMNWGLSDGLFIGAVGGIGGTLSYVFSFTAWGQWLVLCRCWLPLRGRLPWRPVAFLDDAYRRGVLRQTGAVYQFRHIRLQHHLGHAYRGQQARYAPVRLAERPRTPSEPS